MVVQSYRELTVWQKSMDLAREIYALARKLPPEELYGLSSQMRRAAVSIPSNIAEGQARLSAKEFAHFLSIAHGSVAELETQLYLCPLLGFLQQEEIDPCLALLGEIGKMTAALKKAVDSRQ